MKHLLYIGQTPAEGTGSPVIVLRHLRRFARSGWRISIVGEPGQADSACRAEGWEVGLPSSRRFWWPPLHPGSELLRACRTFLLAREISRSFGASPPDAVLGYLAAHDDFSAEIAVRAAGILRRPLTLLVHDHAESFAASPCQVRRIRSRHKRLLRRAWRVCFASAELLDACGGTDYPSLVLPPLPEGWPRPAVWRSVAAECPRIYYAGHAWPAQHRLLRRLARTIQSAGAKLVILARDSKALRETLADSPAEWVAPFATNREALAHLCSNADGLLVSYANTIEELPWSATSFPSKLIEYCHLGIPCAIVAPAETAVSRWAARSGFGPAFRPDDEAGLCDWVVSLKAATSWCALAGVSTALAGDEFNPDKIHARLESELLPCDS